MQARLRIRLRRCGSGGWGRGAFSGGAIALGVDEGFSLRRLLLCLIFVACNCPVSDGAGSLAAPGEPAPVELNIWEIPPSWRRDPAGRSARKVYEAFTEAHPHIRVVGGGAEAGVRILNVPGESTFLLAMAGGIAPDAFSVSIRTVPAYVEQGFIRPIDEFWDPWADKGRIPPKIRAMASSSGHAWGVPIEGGVMGLIYRKDKFEEAGLDPDSPPQTWDELYEYARALTFPERNQYGFALTSPGAAGGSPELAGALFTTFLWQAGGHLVDEVSPGVYAAAYASPEGVAAVQFVDKLRWQPWTRCAECDDAPFDITPQMLQGGAAVCPFCGAKLPIARLEAEGRLYRGVLLNYFTTGTGFGIGDFQVGRLCMIFGDPHVQVRAFSEGMPLYKIGVGALPAGPAGPAAMMGGALHCINGTLTDRRKIEAVWEYIAFHHSPAADEIRTRIYVEDGYGNLVDPKLLAEFGYDWVLDELTPRERELRGLLYEGARVVRVFPGSRPLEAIHLRQVMDAALTAPVDAASLLSRSAESADEELFHPTTPEEARRQRRLAQAIFSVAVVLAVVGFGSAIRMLVQTARAGAGVGFQRVPVSRQLAAWCFMIPALLSILLWQYYPLARGSVMAFQDYYLVKPSVFVGLTNFIEAVSTKLFWVAWRNTLTYVILALSMGFCLPIFVALLLSEVPRGKLAYRMIYLLPAATSGLVIMMMWWWFYDPTEAGLFNSLLARVGLPAQQWLNDSRLAMACIILPGVWAGAGPGSIIYLAMMKSIPEEIYEAADVDGAGVLHKIRHITLPSMKALIIMNFVGAFIGAFHASHNILIMTGGGPQNATYTTGLHIFYNAFLYLRFGHATALAWIMGTVLIGFTVFQLSLLRKVEFRAAG